MSLINQVLQDLEKRHASEPELKSLSPHVRAVSGRPQSSIRVIAVAAIVAVAVIAATAFFYGRRHAPDDESPPILSKPMAVPAPEPIQAARQPDTAPIVEPSAQSAAFSPVSRLSDQLSLVAPLSALKEKPASVGRSTSPGRASSRAEVVTAPLPDPITDGAQPPSVTGEGAKTLPPRLEDPALCPVFGIRPVRGIGPEARSPFWMWSGYGGVASCQFIRSWTSRTW